MVNKKEKWPARTDAEGRGGPIGSTRGGLGAHGFSADVAGRRGSSALHAGAMLTRN